MSWKFNTRSTARDLNNVKKGTMWKLTKRYQSENRIIKVFTFWNERLGAALYNDCGAFYIKRRDDFGRCIYNEGTTWKTKKPSVQSLPYVPRASNTISRNLRRANLTQIHRTRPLYSFIPYSIRRKGKCRNIAIFLRPGTLFRAYSTCIDRRLCTTTQKVREIYRVRGTGGTESEGENIHRKNRRDNRERFTRADKRRKIKRDRKEIVPTSGHGNTTPRRKRIGVTTFARSGEGECLSPSLRAWYIRYEASAGSVIFVRRYLTRSKFGGLRRAGRVIINRRHVRPVVPFGRCRPTSRRNTYATTNSV